MSAQHRFYIVTQDAWYYPDIEDVRPDPEVLVGIKGGEQFAIKWYARIPDFPPRIIMWEESWHLLTEMSDLFEALAIRHNENMSVGDVVGLLHTLGFQDETELETPEDAS